MKKRRIIFIITIALLVMSQTFADSTVLGTGASDSFTIKAFKVGDFPIEGKKLKLIVTDALSESLDVTLGDSPDYEDSIVLDSHIRELLGTTSDLKKQFIFSYRVEGQEVGTFDLTVQIGPLQIDPDNIIGATYYHENSSNMFALSSDTTSKSGKFTITSAQENIPGTSINGTTQFLNSWTITGDESSINTDEVWLVRGAISMSINQDSYDSVKVFGEYSAMCTIQLWSK